MNVSSYRQTDASLLGVTLYLLYNLFVVTAAGVVLCGSPKKQPRTTSIVQFIFFFWSFEISGNILRNQKFYMFRPMYSKQVLLFGPHLDLYQSFYRLPC